MRRAVGMTIRGELGLTEGTCWWIDKRELAFVSAEPFRPGAVVRVRCDFGRELIDMDLRIVRQLDKQWAPRPLRGVPHVARFRLVDKSDKRDLRDGIRRVNPELFEDESQSTSSHRSHSASRASQSAGAPSFAFRDREDRFRERNKDEEDTRDVPTWAMASQPPSTPPKRPTRRDGVRDAKRKAAGARTSTPTDRASSKPKAGSMAAKVEERRRKRAARLREAAKQGTTQPAPTQQEELHSTAASISRAGGPPTVFVAFEDLDLARRSLKASGSSIWCAVGDDGTLSSGDTVLLVLQLPNHVYLQVQARVTGRSGGSTTLLAADVPADAQMLSAILS